MLLVNIKAKEQTQYKKDQKFSFKRLFTEPRFIILFIGLLISGFNSSYVKVTFKAFINSLADEDYSIKLMKNETLYLSCIFDAAVYFSHKQMIQSFGTNWMFAIGHWSFGAENFRFLLHYTRRRCSEEGFPVWHY